MKEAKLNSQSLKKKISLSLIMLSLITFSIQGCVYLVVGGIGAVGGYIVSPDTVEGITENDSITVWETAYEVISIMGTIQEEQQEGGLILATVSGAKVTVSILPLNQSTVKVTVKARKAYLPKISTAQDVFVKIMSRLNE